MAWVFDLGGDIALVIVVASDCVERDLELLLRESVLEAIDEALTMLVAMNARSIEIVTLRKNETDTAKSGGSGGHAIRVVFLSASHWFGVAAATPVANCQKVHRLSC